MLRAFNLKPERGLRCGAALARGLMELLLSDWKVPGHIPAILQPFLRDVLRQCPTLCFLNFLLKCRVKSLSSGRLMRVLKLHVCYDTLLAPSGLSTFVMLT